jgi:hypothetical protein
MSALANIDSQESHLVDEAVSWLAQRLPAGWSASRSERMVEGGAGSGSRVLDAAIDLKASNGTWTTLAVEARRAFSPRDAQLLLSGVARSLRALAGHIPVLVVAPWLSERTQQLLAAEEINYLDLTGNASIRLDNPALYVRSAGAQRNPEPAARAPARVRGAKAGRVVRLLADVRPPYGVLEIGAATGLTQGYVSRLVDALDREALVERERRGPVLAVDGASLLRRWAQSYDVFKSNTTATFLAPEGAAAALDRIARLRGAGRVAVTGSFAAVRHAPVAAPALLAAYCEDPQRVAAELGLLPADVGANVVLLRPFDEVVWSRAERAGDVTYAAVSQVAVDCLTGNGRMPAEGEALLDWMTANEERWRARALGELAPPAASA